MVKETLEVLVPFLVVIGSHPSERLMEWFDFVAVFVLGVAPLEELC